MSKMHQHEQKIVFVNAFVILDKDIFFQYAGELGEQIEAVQKTHPVCSIVVCMYAHAKI